VEISQVFKVLVLYKPKEFGVGKFSFYNAPFILTFTLYYVET